MTVDREELKPCPFCGRTDLLGFEPYPGSGFLGVRCRACGCIGKAGRGIVGEPTAEAEASAHWNNQRGIADLTAQLAASRDINRHYEQERDSWGAAYRQRAAKTDERIKELEAGLREALDWAAGTPDWDRLKTLRPGYTSELRPMLTRLGDVTREEALDRLRKLLPSEDR